MGEPFPNKTLSETPSERRLDSWKEIATYLDRDVTTVQRWERQEGMPVHRQLHQKRGSVYALCSELDAWRQGRKLRSEEEQELAMEAAGADGRQTTVPRGHRWLIPSTPRRYTWLLWTFVALLVAGLSGWFAANGPRPAVRNPLSSAQFTRLANLSGAKSDPAISPDGNFAAFISNRSGTFDIWLSQTNGNNLTNLTQGRIGDARAPLRAVGFSGDGLEVWSSGTEGKRLMLWPLIGGAPHNFPDEKAAEVAWSPDGTRLVYHTWQAGDPTFVADHDGGNPRLILQNDPGLHNHYQVWSKDGRWIYFVRGRPSTREMDLWRVSPEGGKPEQLTHLNTDIAYPTPIDGSTVLFVAHNKDWACPCLWAFD